jgi:hypothetical protein
VHYVGFVRDLSAYFHFFPRVHGDETGLITCTLCVVFGKLHLLTCVMIVTILFQIRRCSVAPSPLAYYLKQGCIVAMNMCK